ncbi:ArsR family transcriptional regulator [Halobacteriales archaeon QS_6_71_20]|nr:MAG: ArsR family transcriptional regulator [Halobacteriales archaeon QS_6_71_20]
MSGTRPPGSGDSDADDASGDAADPRSDGGTAAADAAGAAGSPPEPVGPGDSDAAGDGDDVRVCWLDDDDADDLIGALAPGTARSILSAVHEEPRTASELADHADTSVQNVRHHVSKLVDAELVEAADTEYSVKGREMTVYGPADERVVVAVGGDDERSSLVDSLRSLLGAAAVLAGASLLVQALFGAGAATLSEPGTAPRVGDAASATDAGGALLGVLPPGMAFLAGGLLVLATVLAADRLRGR